MDIAKIRKKAKEKEEAERASETHPPRQEAPSEPVAPPAAAAGEEKEEGPKEQAGPVAGEEAAEEETAGPAVEDEAPPPPPVDKQGERGFSGETESDGEGAVLELLTFSIANEEFAFRVPEVEEIIRYQRITKVPTMPDYVIGITSLRGKIIPVLDLKRRLGLKGEAGAEEHTKTDGKILIMAGPKGMIGASIQKVLGVVRFDEGTILDPPGHLSEEALRFIEGVVIREKRFTSIIRSYDALDVELT